MIMKMLLISGHGAGDPGAVAKIKGKTYKEADEAIVMVKKIKEQLKSYNMIVDIYPTNRNAYEDAKAGKLQMDLGKYDYVLEIHFNACVNDLKGNGRVTGAEAYITTQDKTQKVENHMLDYLNTIGLKKRSVKSHNYTVIQRAKTNGADSCLLEVCFIDDADDMVVYTKNKDAVAKAIAQGIIKGYSIKKKENKSASTLKVGAAVKIKSGAKDANTKKKYKSFVYNTVYTVLKISGDYVIFGLSGVATGKTKKTNVTLQ